MKKLSKLLSALLVAAMLLTMTACNNAAVAQTDPPSEQNSNAPEQQDTDQPGQIASEPGGPSAEDYNWPKFIVFLGASSGGNAILTVSAMAQVITETLPTTVSAQVTPGGSQNMYLMEQGEGSYAWGNDFQIYTATNGLLTFADAPVNIDMNMIIDCSATVWQLTVRKGSGITCVEDLRGKRVVVGPSGSTTEPVVRNMMTALGLCSKDGTYDFQAEYASVSEGCDMISNGQADAMFNASAIPASSYVEMFVTDKIELIGFTDEEIDKIEAAELGQTRVTIPAGSYDGKVPNDLGTVGNWGGLICKADCNEEEVYWITRTLCENWDKLGTYHDVFNSLTAEEGAKACISPYVDIHPGALRYYQEMGWM